MNRENIYLSTVAADASHFAREFGFGLEIAEYCTAWNMDEKLEKVDKTVRKKLDGISENILHAPYNELFPCAIDKMARDLAAYRYRQAIDLAKGYGSKKVVIHGGYNPWIYYPVWYVGQSVAFWKEFLEKDPGVQIVLENVLETQPDLILDIVEGVNDPRFRMCLDVGHVNAYSYVPLMEWLETCAPWISHFHLHNNDGKQDLHNGLQDGSIPMKELLQRIEELCPDATMTLEVVEAKDSVEWLMTGVLKNA